MGLDSDFSEMFNELKGRDIASMGSDERDNHERDWSDLRNQVHLRKISDALASEGVFVPLGGEGVLGDSKGEFLSKPLSVSFNLEGTLVTGCNYDAAFRSVNSQQNDVYIIDVVQKSGVVEATFTPVSNLG